MAPKRLVPSLLLFICFGIKLDINAQGIHTQTLTIHHLTVPLNSFVPDKTLGAAYDGYEKGQNDLILQPANVAAMQSVDLKPLTYRLRTELGIEAWHWNPKGTWSSNNEGYWVSSSDPNDSISVSYGYRLPRRGNTGDEANNDGYSRIDDGDETTFWKSNPYLDSVFTGESNSEHPQWVVIDLGKERMVDAISIHWGSPRATEFTVDYGTPAVYPYFEASGYYEIDSPLLWKPFPQHLFRHANAENTVLRLSANPVKVRMIRIRMSRSNTQPGSKHVDIRDNVGFAIREVFIGLAGKDGKLSVDYVHHSTDNQQQSRVTVSSTDPWHRASDIDTSVEQLGIDRLFHSGLTGHLPVLLPTGVLYDVPENSLAMVDYLIKKNYPIQAIELGEEPDGQDVSPEDYGALYDRWIKIIHAKYPGLELGGPSLQTLILDQNDEMMPSRNWIQRLLYYLQKHGSLDAFKFFSFEWYPFDDACGPAAPQLRTHPSMIQKGMHDLQQVPQLANVPIYITEYGYSAFGGINDMQIQSALMNADIVGQFLTLHGNKAYLYGIVPSVPDTGSICAAGNNMMFGMDDNGKVSYRTATYYGALMMKKYWAQPAGDSVRVYPVSSTMQNKQGEELVSAYALLTPDNNWSLMVINKDPNKSYRVSVKVDEGGKASSLRLPLTCYQYSGKQYKWVVDGENSHPSKSLPPVEKTIRRNLIELPPFSLTVLKQTR